MFLGDWYSWEHGSFASFSQRFDPAILHHFIKGNCMKRKPIVRERNCFVRLALFRKAGAHRKTNKALRRAQKQEPLGDETLR
jgi:hypothetical protein